MAIDILNIEPSVIFTIKQYGIFTFRESIIAYNSTIYE